MSEGRTAKAAKNAKRPDNRQSPIVTRQSDERWMRAALAEAEAAAVEGEVPVGCVVVSQDRIVGRGHNRTETLKDPTAHAEILAVGAAATAIGSWRLTGCTVYATVEPCLMCSGALVLSRPDRVVFGARDPKFGCLGSRYDIASDNRFNHRLVVTEGVLAVEAAGLMKRFFAGKRRRAAIEGDGIGSRHSTIVNFRRDGRVDDGA